MTLVSRLWKEESGQGMAEYGLILALVAVLCVAAFLGLKDAIVGKLDEVSGQINSPSAPSDTPEG